MERVELVTSGLYAGSAFLPGVAARTPVSLFWDVRMHQQPQNVRSIKKKTPEIIRANLFGELFDFPYIALLELYKPIRQRRIWIHICKRITRSEITLAATS